MVEVDERLTTRQADRALVEAGGGLKDRRKGVDQLAAATTTTSAATGIHACSARNGTQAMSSADATQSSARSR